ncbi:hypothetical protein BH686_04375 [Rhodococcus erythropolis]|nr:hypothetical protein BH686_04375 [Rhodococcus erythropolis]
MTGPYFPLAWGTLSDHCADVLSAHTEGELHMALIRNSDEGTPEPDTILGSIDAMPVAPPVVVQQDQESPTSPGTDVTQQWDDIDD